MAMMAAAHSAFGVGSIVVVAILAIGVGLFLWARPRGR